MGISDDRPLELDERPEPEEGDRLGDPVIAFVAVHGIGRQRPGETADAVADAFTAACSDVGAEFVEQEATGGSADRAGTLSVGEDTAQVQFVDAWWDGHVTPPPLGRVLRWMLRVTPFAVLMTIATWMSDLNEASEASPRRQRIPLEVLGIAAAALALLLTPVLMLALLVINTVAIWRPNAWPRLTDVVLTTFGDAWLYRSDELNADVLPRLRNLVEEVRASADTVILVGHSQGAEIARRIALDVKVDACVWVGGALSQLAIVRTLRNSPLLPYVLWLYTLLSPLFFSVVVAKMLQILTQFVSEMTQGFWSLLRTAQSGADVDGAMQASDAMFDLAFADLPWMLAFGAFSIAAVFVLRACARWPDDIRQTPDCPTLEVKSLADPVCFGRMDPSSLVRYVPIRSGGNLWREHIAYFEKPETGTALLETIVAPEIVPAPYQPRFSLWTKAVALLLTGALIGGAYLLGAQILNLFGW